MANSIPRDHMARVSCCDDVWAEFKRLAQIDHWQPVNEYLGELVAREVERQQRLCARAEDATAGDVLGALDQVKGLRDGLEGITARLEDLSAKRAVAAVRAPLPRGGGPISSGWSASPAGGDSEPADLPDWEH